MDYKLLIDTAALAGMIMLENGAEIYRVEETIDYMLKTSGLKTTQAFVVSTGFMISLDDPSIDALTVVRRVDRGATNLNMIAQVNDISRKFYNIIRGGIFAVKAFKEESVSVVVKGYMHSIRWAFLYGNVRRQWRGYAVYRDSWRILGYMVTRRRQYEA